MMIKVEYCGKIVTDRDRRFIGTLSETILDMLWEELGQYPELNTLCVKKAAEAGEKAVREVLVNWFAIDEKGLNDETRRAQ